MNNLRYLKHVFGFVSFLWILEILDVFVMNQRLNQFGILPRTQIGLKGILFCPFLHGNFTHLIANSIPLLIMGSLILLKGPIYYYRTLIFSIFIGGFLVWCLGGNGIHIGASGIVFSFFGFLVIRGFLEKKFFPLLLSLLIIFLYGGIVLGLLPIQKGVSWEGHLFGLVAGIFSARVK